MRQLTTAETLFVIFLFPLSLIYLFSIKDEEDYEEDSEPEGLNWDNDPDIR